MASVKLAPFAVFLLAAFLMFPMKKVEGVDCTGAYCDDLTGCGDYCFCDVIYFLGNQGVCVPYSAMKKKVEENPNLCQTHTECKKKGSGNFCARHINSDVKYGFCFASFSEAQDAYKMAITSNIKKDFLKIPGTTAY
ncbi:putative albumin I chain a [Medicago truncatula]|uniref:Leginsulin/Albumin-1 n=1 Tax=Medicago truncatula TaxID=3880 RepID=G7J9F8_MEDTR|nr:albumin-1 [Medicago truncatula]AES70993.1 Leginsulin/Albumin-1 [Medicago truncatula]AFK46336.1 unknown [Medicago truncatula]KEH34642.1 Leginsulin/Albumin-1 [Medicago truncatula]RHN68181.1 putative albumin I chain a [Medicago truncatula]